jgi:flavin-dependent dehydrogenase
LEDEFPCLHHSKACRLWFFQEKLPGYAWYVPKVDGYVNIGVGGKARSLLQRGDSIKHHWNFLVQRLATEGLVSGRELHPTGYSYMLRGNNTQIHQDSAYLVGDAAGLATIDMGEGIGPAIQSALLAAEAILTNSEYTISGIPRYSFPSILGLRRENHHIALSYERR